MWSDPFDTRWDALAVVVRSKFEVENVSNGSDLRTALDMSTLAMRLVETIGIEFNSDRPAGAHLLCWSSVHLPRNIRAVARADDIGQAEPGDLCVAIRPKLVTDT